MFDGLGDRMKGQYENRSRFYLPRRTYVIVRIDGRAFHSVAKHTNKPFDEDLCRAFKYCAEGLVKDFQGAAFAYSQSDEISLLLTDFANKQTEAAWDYNLQKLCSISASLCTALFNHHVSGWEDPYKLRGHPHFDSRAFVIPDRIEVMNYFVWRQKDCIRNSIQSLGQAHFSPKELNGKSMIEVTDMLMAEKGIDWAESPQAFKNGVLTTANGDSVDLDFAFAANPDFLMKLIPEHGY